MQQLPPQRALGSAFIATASPPPPSPPLLSLTYFSHGVLAQAQGMGRLLA